MKYLLLFLLISNIGVSNAQTQHVIEDENFVLHFKSGEVRPVEKVEVFIRNAHVESCYFDGEGVKKNEISHITFDRDGKTITARLYEINVGMWQYRFMYVLKETESVGIYKSVFNGLKYYSTKQSKDSKKFQDTKVLSFLKSKDRFLKQLDCQKLYSKYSEFIKEGEMTEELLIEAVDSYSENCE